MGLMPTPGKAPPAEEQQERDPSRFTDDSDNGVSPEEQAQYSQFEQNYMKLIYDGQGDVQPGILEALDPNNKEAQAAGEGMDQPQGQQPPAADPNAPPADEGESIGNIPPAILSLAHTAVQIVTQLDDSAREAGKPLSDDVLTQGGAAVIEELVEVSEAAGLHDYSEQDMQGALTVAMDMYRPKAIADGRTDDDTLKNQWGEVVQADQEGRLGDAVPQLAESKPEGA